MAKIPEIRPPASSRLAFQGTMTRMRIDLARLIKSQLYPRLSELRLQAGSDFGMRQDSVVDDVAVVMAKIGLLFSQLHPDGRTAAEVGVIGRSVHASASRQVGKQLLAIGVSPASQAGANASLLQAFVRQNVLLIKTLNHGQVGQIEALVLDSFRRGIHVSSIKKEIQAKLRVGRARASLLARDQVLKLHGQFAQIEQVDAGIEEYVWRTVRDERVRPGHKALDGTKQKWNKPPVVSSRKGVRRAHPGGDYQCRCYAEPAMPDLGARGGEKQGAGSAGSTGTGLFAMAAIAAAAFLFGDKPEDDGF